jgi:zinc transporter 9
MFFLGCGVSLAHGIGSLADPHDEVGDGTLNIGILVFALVVESASLLVALYALAGTARASGQSLRAYVASTEDPFGVAVLLEDGAAVFGVLIAIAAVGLSAWTHNPVWDAVGTLAVATLMGAVAIWLIGKNRAMLVGRTVSASGTAAFVTALEQEAVVARVVEHRTEVSGADTWTLTAQVAFQGRALNDAELSEADLATACAAPDTASMRTWLDVYAHRLMRRLASEVDRIEQRVRERLPKATTIHIEPD